MRTMHHFGHFLAGLAFVAGISAVVMLLWNWLIPSILGWAAINYWQAIGLLVLSRIFFGGFGNHWRHLRSHDHDHHNPIREKWMKMSPEEQKEFIEKRKEHAKRHHAYWCGRGKRNFFDRPDFDMTNPSEKENE